MAIKKNIVGTGRDLSVISHKLKNKRILITAGPTWIPIDSVRVISNIATGQTGILLAEKFREYGAKITLVLGPVGETAINRDINLIKFKFFDELKDIICREISSKRYDAIIHSSAVSDYRVKNYQNKKIKSGINNLKLELIPTAKIIDSIKKIDPDIFLAGFKFEPNVSKYMLLENAKALIKRSKLDLTVANTLTGSSYKAYIMFKDRVFGPLICKKDLVNRLVKVMGECLCKRKS